MKKIIIALMITALIACALVSCADKNTESSADESSLNESNQNESTVSNESSEAVSEADESEVSDESENEPEESDTSEEEKEEIKVKISIEYASEELLADKDSYILYDDPDTDYSLVAIRIDTTVTNFRYFSIVSTDTWTDDGAPKVNKVLYTIQEFTPDTIFVAETVFADVYSIRGISFVDANGNTQYYSLWGSAVDDTISLGKADIAE